ncbi:MAG: YncE family protein, partial [Bacteroidales bacterium]|nr:YncE family protein [Bacteroidales bacterium]
MKKLTLLISGTVLAILVASCDKSQVTNRISGITSEDDSLAGVNVAAGETSGPFMKLFVLNEGKMGTDNASLDFFRYSNGRYCRNTFKMMNPDISLGLGDVGNDIKVWKNTVWMTINNSGIVEVINAINEKHLASITVPSCRNIAFYGDYAYVTSYSGAVYGGNDIKGAVYKIYIGTMSVVDSVHVGYQPEGIAEYGGKLYVANGGGFHTGYDNTLTILDP